MKIEDQISINIQSNLENVFLQSGHSELNLPFISFSYSDPKYARLALKELNKMGRLRLIIDTKITNSSEGAERIAISNYYLQNRENSEKILICSAASQQYRFLEYFKDNIKEEGEITLLVQSLYAPTNQLPEEEDRFLIYGYSFILTK